MGLLFGIFQCSQRVPTPTRDARGGPPPPGQAARTLAQAQPELPPGVGYVQVSGHRPEKFLLQTAVLHVPAPDALDPERLKALLQGRNLEAHPGPPSPPFQARKLRPKAPDLRAAPPQPRRTTPVVVKALQLGGSLAAVDKVIATESKLPPGQVTFSSETAKRVFAYVLQHRHDPGPQLSPRFLTEQAGIFNKTEEGRLFWGMDKDRYWALHNLRDMWSLVFAAEKLESNPPPIAIAVVDQGFVSQPIDMTWDYAFGNPNDMDQCRQSGVRWHGTDCGSIIASAANDTIASAGTTLVVPGSALPQNHIPPVIRVAAVMPPEEVTVDLLASAIENSISQGAHVVSASYRSWCGFFCIMFQENQALLDALAYAEQRHVAVLLGGGNDRTELPNNPIWPFEYLTGCQRGGQGLCIGGVDVVGKRWSESNWGESIVTSAPASYVAVSALPHRNCPNEADMDPETPRAFDGTSAATAFTAGVIALAESVWGQRYSNSELRAMLKQSNRTLEQGGDPILDAAAFLRQKLVLARDDEEPNNVLGDVEARPPALPKLETTYKLTTDSDTDLFPIQFSTCTSTSVEMHYVADWEDMNVPSAISLTILNPDGTVTATGARTALGTFVLTGATLDANKKYYLKVSNEVPAGSPKALPTAYDLNVATTACAN